MLEIVFCTLYDGANNIIGDHLSSPQCAYIHAYQGNNPQNKKSGALPIWGRPIWAQFFGCPPNWAGSELQYGSFLGVNKIKNLQMILDEIRATSKFPVPRLSAPRTYLRNVMKAKDCGCHILIMCDKCNHRQSPLSRQECDHLCIIKPWAHQRTMITQISR